MKSSRSIGSSSRLAPKGVAFGPLRQGGRPTDSFEINKKEEQADRGPFAVPKIFRRQLRYSVLQQNNLAPKTFNDYLAGKPLKGQTKKGTTDAWTTRAAILA